MRPICLRLLSVVKPVTALSGHVSSVSSSHPRPSVAGLNASGWRNRLLWLPVSRILSSPRAEHSVAPSVIFFRVDEYGNGDVFGRRVEANSHRLWTQRGGREWKKGRKKEKKRWRRISHVYIILLLYAYNGIHEKKNRKRYTKRERTKQDNILYKIYENL